MRLIIKSKFILKIMLSTTDVSASINLAMLIADRCNKYGITQMKFHAQKGFRKSPQVSKTSENFNFKNELILFYYFY